MNFSSPPHLERLKDLVHYICRSCKDPTSLGATKLNKILWYSDAMSFKYFGRPITNETYVKRQHGPVPYNVLKVLAALESEKAIAIRQPSAPFETRGFIGLTEPNLDSFSGREISLVDTLVREICDNHTARSISHATHDRIWELAEIGEEIPLHAVLAAELGEITEDDVEWAREQISRAA